MIYPWFILDSRNTEAREKEGFGDGENPAASTQTKEFY